MQLGDRSKQHGLTKEDTECHDDQQDHCRPHHRVGCGQQVDQANADGDNGQSDCNHGGRGLEDVVSEHTCNEAGDDANETGREDTKCTGGSVRCMEDQLQVRSGGVDQVDVAPVNTHAGDTCEPDTGLCQNLEQTHESCGVLGVAFGLGNSVGGNEAQDGDDVRDQQQRVCKTEADHDAVCVGREDSHAADDDEVHAELNATTDGLEEAHCKATALGVRVGCHEGNAVDDGGPTDGVPNCPRNCNANKHLDVQVVAQDRGEPQEQEGQQSPRGEGDQNVTDGETVVHPAGGHVHEHGDAEPAHDGTEVGDRDAKSIGHGDQQRSLERLEGDVDQLAGQHDSEEAADAALLQELRKARLCAY